MNQFETGLIIGRFQPPHRGHMDLIQQLLQIPCTQYIIGIGSANQSLSQTNPLDFETRKLMFGQILADMSAHHIAVYPIDDQESDIERVHTIITSINPSIIISGNQRVHDCFESTQIPCVMPTIQIDISATQIRQAWIQGNLINVKKYLHPYVWDYLVSHTPPQQDKIGSSF